MIENYYGMYYYRITKSHCNNDNYDNNVMSVRMWFELFGGLC